MYNLLRLVLFSAPRVFLYFPHLACGGLAFGFLVGKVTVFWLKNVYHNALVEITITVVATYLTFYIGEFILGVSGVLAVAMLGLELSANKTSISPEQEVFLHRYVLYKCSEL